MKPQKFWRKEVMSINKCLKSLAEAGRLRIEWASREMPKYLKLVLGMWERVSVRECRMFSVCIRFDLFEFSFL